MYLKLNDDYTNDHKELVSADKDTNMSSSSLTNTDNVFELNSNRKLYTADFTNVLELMVKAVFTPSEVNQWC